MRAPELGTVMGRGAGRGLLGGGGSKQEPGLGAVCSDGRGYGLETRRNGRETWAQ